MSIEMKNKKHTNSIAMIFLLVLFIALVIAFKLINQATNGTSEWVQTIANSGLVESKYVDATWFTNNGLSHFLTGPIGFKSFAQFKLVTRIGENNIFLLPVFWDLLINWIALVGTIFLVISIILSFVNENRINRILSEKGSTTAAEEVKEITKDEIKQEAKELEEKLEEVVVVKKPVKKKTKKPVAKKQTVKKVAEPKVEEVKVAETKKPVAKKQTVKKVAEPKVEEVKVAETKKPEVALSTSKNETVYVIKKHYNQVSKKDLLIKIEEANSEFSKKSVKKVVDSAFEIMSNAILNNEEIVIPNFGKLSKIHKEAKKGKNPLTGESIDILASNTVKFKANKHLKENMSKGKWTGLTKVKKEIKK
ncbi:HU family DNA-binding protein [Mesoplasma tabanidae]|uniref:Viral histone-like protein n=1 Tax=Mesoplasma tabanidae TaxID=219745 RepID=A0A2K8P582_9MOLU|nr:HU family DNA-binding protein [Mesoplasma tabanidae]ATZ21914.1 30S ribosomal protein S6 [Mesoplasma tabanidae]